MSTSTIGSTTASGTAAQQIATAQGKSVLGKDDFMKLMIAQLKNQDPMNPMDGSQYAAQLAQFSSVEQLMNINTTLDTSVNANYQLTQSINNTMTPALIGKEVKLQGGTVTNNDDSSITLGYSLPATVSSATVKVFDKNGALVKEFTDANKEMGDHKLEWDFTDINGQKVPKGDYTFTVDAKDSQGAAITAGLFKYGTISGIRFTSTGTKLVIGKSEYLLSDVQEIVNPGS